MSRNLKPHQTQGNQAVDLHSGSWLRCQSKADPPGPRSTVRERHRTVSYVRDDGPSSRLVRWARSEAARYLDVPEFRMKRWRHVQAVGAKAEQLAAAYTVDGKLLAASAWLHDIGYSPELQRTGFHPIDGARCLDSMGASPRLSALVANHSGAALEAQLRGLQEEMQRYPDDADAVRDALWACDTPVAITPSGSVS